MTTLTKGQLAQATMLLEKLAHADALAADRSHCRVCDYPHTPRVEGVQGELLMLARVAFPKAKLSVAKEHTT